MKKPRERRIHAARDHGRGADHRHADGPDRAAHLRPLRQAKADIAKAGSDRRSRSQLELYKLDNGNYPTTEQGLDALVHEPTGEPRPRRYPEGGYVSSTGLERSVAEPVQVRAPGQEQPARATTSTRTATTASPAATALNADIGNWEVAAPRARETHVARGRAQDGFTLLELMIVITLIVLITGVFATSIGGGFGVHIRNSGRALAAELEYVSQRAVTTGRAQRFVIDLDQQLFRVEMRAAARRPSPTARCPSTPRALARAAAS